MLSWAKLNHFANSSHLNDDLSSYIAMNFEKHKLCQFSIPEAAVIILQSMLGICHNAICNIKLIRVGNIWLVRISCETNSLEELLMDMTKKNSSSCTLVY